MSEVQQGLKYAKSHEWIRDEGDGTVTIGITDHAQQLLGDMVFIELPEVGAELDTEEECAVVESVKAASDVYAPIAGTVTEVNEAVVDAPELANQDPFGDGWLFKLKIADQAEYDALLDPAEYSELVEEES
ncbi:MAG: glycine cleavage system protein GcvH [Gammaproteobacteria bacterium]|nr:glycine cleavage system protein GcvH [Gammaproteobacteria bacterium]